MSVLQGHGPKYGLWSDHTLQLSHIAGSSRIIVLSHILFILFFTAGHCSRPWHRVLDINKGLCCYYEGPETCCCSCTPPPPPVVQLPCPLSRGVSAQQPELASVLCAADRVHDGVFGAMMNVELVNDGPVTFILDSGHQGH